MKDACSASFDWKLDGAPVCTMDIGSYPHGRESNAILGADSQYKRVYSVGSQVVRVSSLV